MGGVISCENTGEVLYPDYNEEDARWHVGNLGYCNFEDHFEQGRALGTGSFGLVRCENKIGSDR